MAGTATGAAKRERRPDGTFVEKYREGPRGTSRADVLQMRFVRADNMPGQPDALPPNMGRPPVQHSWQFQSLLSSYAHVYRPSDEAYRHSRDNARFMRNDCSVMECLESRKRATALLNWHVEPEDSKSEEQKQLCQAIEKVIRKTPFFKKYRESLLEALWFGRYANTHAWKWTWIDGKKRAYVGDWKPINGDKLKFRYDDGTGKYDPNEVGVRVLRTAIPRERQEQVDITDEGTVYFLRPWERNCLAVHRHIIEDGAFEDPLSAGMVHGVGIRSRIYWTWFQAAETTAMLLEFMEKFGMGFAIGFYPAGDAQAREELGETLKNMRHDNHVLVPRTNGDPSLDAYGIEIVQPTPAGAETLKTIIQELFGDRIKRYILGQTLTTESNGAGLGSSGISDLHKWSFYQIIKSDAIDLEETITNELLRPLVRFNFPEYSNLDLRFKIETDSPDVQGELEAFNVAYNMGLRIKAEDVYNVVGLSKPGDDDEVLEMAAQSGGFDALAAAGMGGSVGGKPFGQDGNGKGVHETLKETLAGHRAEEAAKDKLKAIYKEKSFNYPRNRSRFRDPVSRSLANAPSTRSELREWCENAVNAAQIHEKTAVKYLSRFEKQSGKSPAKMLAARAIGYMTEHGGTLDPGEAADMLQSIENLDDLPPILLRVQKWCESHDAPAK